MSSISCRGPSSAVATVVAIAAVAIVAAVVAAVVAAPQTEKSIALASGLTAAESDVVTATSSGCPPTSRANVARAASVRSTQ